MKIALAAVVAAALAASSLAVSPVERAMGLGSRPHVPKRHQAHSAVAPASAAVAAPPGSGLPDEHDADSEADVANQAAADAARASGVQGAAQVAETKWFLQGLDEMPKGFNPANPSAVLPSAGAGPANPIAQDLALHSNEPAGLGGAMPMALIALRGRVSARGAPAIVFKTTKGSFTLNLRPDWAPVGVKHVLELARAGFYSNTAFFRVLTGFIAQWGISGDPATNQRWQRTIADDTLPAGVTNQRGTVTFATAGANTRTTQLFVNFGDNMQLDGMGFTPIGTVSPQDMQVLDRLYADYGEGAPSGNGPDQGRMQREGNTYLRAEFPYLDYVLSTEVVEQ